MGRSAQQTRTHAVRTDARDLALALQDEIKEADAKAIILSGGPNSVHVEGAPRLPEGFFEYVQGAPACSTRVSTAATPPWHDRRRCKPCTKDSFLMLIIF